MQPVFELFSDIFAYRDNPLTRIDARVKLIIAVLAILCTIVCRGVKFPLAMFLACMAAMPAIRIPFKLVFVRLAGPLGIVLVVILLQSFLIGGTPLFSVPVFGWKVELMREGVGHGVLLGARVLGSVSVLLLLSSTTKAHKIFHALRWMGFPKGWVEVATLMYRYVFMLLDQAGDIMDAQRVRLGYWGLKRSVSSLGQLAGTVIKTAMDQGMRTYQAMELRGYNGSMPFGDLPSLCPRDLRVLFLTSTLVLTGYVVLEWIVL